MASTTQGESTIDAWLQEIAQVLAMQWRIDLSYGSRHTFAWHSIYRATSLPVAAIVQRITGHHSVTKNIYARHWTCGCPAATNSLGQTARLHYSYHERSDVLHYCTVGRGYVHRPTCERYHARYWQQ